MSPSVPKVQFAAARGKGVVFLKLAEVQLVNKKAQAAHDSGNYDAAITAFTALTISSGATRNSSPAASPSQLPIAA